MGAKSVVRKVIALPLLPEWLARLTDTQATIFMAHRFSVPDGGLSAQEPQALRRTLAELRKRRYDLISIEELFRRLLENEPLRRAVAFTIDDGYFDQGHIAGPIFAEFDCPATIFTVSDFIDGKIWLWWDQMAYIFRHTRRPEIVAHVGAEEFRFPLRSDADRMSYFPFSIEIQEAPHADRVACIQEMAQSAEVEIPACPPEKYRPLSWEEIRDLERKGLSFGPHTLTHPVLSTTTAEQSAREITQSWERLKTQVAHPVPVFCYPAGGPTHFGEREVATIRTMGLAAAVTAERGNIDPGRFHNGGGDNAAAGRYRIPRRPFTDELADTFQSVSGLEKIKSRISASLRRP